MIENNKQIRNAVKDALQTVFSGEIYTTRAPDVREGADKYLNVFLQSGDVDYNEGLVAESVSILTIGVHIALVDGKSPTDDDLDELAESLLPAVPVHGILPEVIQGIVPTDFEYSDEEEGEYSSLFLRFNLHY